jgi:hypothetical protein
MDGDDKTTTSAATGRFPSMAHVCACGGLGPMWLNGIAYWEEARSRIANNQIKSNLFSLQLFSRSPQGGETEQIG